MPDVTTSFDNTTTIVVSRYFPTFTFAAQTVAQGVASVVAGARRRRRVFVVAAGLAATSVAWTLRRRGQNFFSRGRASSTNCPRRVRRSPASSVGVAFGDLREFRRRKVGTASASAGLASVSEVPTRRRRVTPTTSGVANTSTTRVRMAADIIDSAGVAITHSSGAAITGVY